jgi:hypothetical protein
MEFLPDMGSFWFDRGPAVLLAAPLISVKIVVRDND